MIRMGKKGAKALLMQHGSTIRVWCSPVQPLQFMVISFTGPAAKIPSVSNNRMHTVEKRPLKKILEQGAIGGLSAAACKHAMKLLEDMRPRSIRNPEHQDMIRNWTRLYSQVIPTTVSFNDDKDTRLFGLVRCGPINNRCDTHNLNKATCDWLQEMGIIKNDSHIDMLPVRKKDYGIAGDNTEIFIVRSEKLSSIRLLFDELARLTVGGSCYDNSRPYRDDRSNRGNPLARECVRADGCEDQNDLELGSSDHSDHLASSDCWDFGSIGSTGRAVVNE